MQSADPSGLQDDLAVRGIDGAAEQRLIRAQ